jgi:uncharacterized protein YecE (DUF72 family)
LRPALGFSNYPRTMTTARIGEMRLPKNFKRYTKQFSLLELDCEPGNVPGKPRLQAFAAEAPAGFTFSLLVPSRVASLESGPEFDKAWKAASNVARVLKAQWWVVRTPAEVRPTRRSRESLAALVARLKEGGMRVAWEPRGVWDEVAAGETADAIGAAFVQDVAREVPRPGRVLYTRLLALGRGGRVGLSLADVVAERLSRYEEAFVAVEGQGAREIQQALGMALDDAALDAAGDEVGLDDDDSSDDEPGDEGELANGLDTDELDDAAGHDADDDLDDDELDDEDEER